MGNKEPNESCPAQHPHHHQSRSLDRRLPPGAPLPGFCPGQAAIFHALKTDDPGVTEMKDLLNGLVRGSMEMESEEKVVD